MTSAGWLPIIVIIIPVCVILGWMARCVAGRLDARYPTPRPLWTPGPGDLEPVHDSRWEDSQRYHPQRQQLPTPVINIHVAGMPSWQQPRVVDYMPITPEITQG